MLLIFKLCSLNFIFRCRKKCFDSISPENREEILTRLYSMTSKNQQDSFLQSLIEVLKVQRHRPRKIENPRVNSFSFQYFVYVGEFKKLVCLKAFLSLHSVSMKRIKRLRDLTILGKSPKDQRGLHNASNALSGEIKVGMLNHIESFPTKLSHYSDKEVKYLNEQLSVKTMYNLFKAKYPNVKVGYVSYYKFFKDNFELKFGRPQVDVCCTWENLNLKIKNPCLNDAAKKVAVAELMVHKRRSKKFYNKLKVEVEEKNKNKLILKLCALIICKIYVFLKFLSKKCFIGDNCQSQFSAFMISKLENRQFSCIMKDKLKKDLMKFVLFWITT